MTLFFFFCLIQLLKISKLFRNIFFLLWMFFYFSELPAGWEKIEDPVYGIYYVE